MSRLANIPARNHLLSEPPDRLHNPFASLLAKAISRQINWFVSTTLTEHSNPCLNAGGIQLRILIKCKMNAAKKSIKEKNVYSQSSRSFHYKHEVCPESIQPFWISREPVAWPWCNLVVSQRRPYRASMSSHSPVGLVSRQWEAVDWACVLGDRRIHNGRAGRSASSRQCACPFYSSRAGLFGKASYYSGLLVPYTPDLALCDFRLFPKLKSPLKGRRFVNEVTQYKSSFNGVSLPTD